MKAKPLIFALMLGCESVLGLDFDPQAPSMPGEGGVQGPEDDGGMESGRSDAAATVTHYQWTRWAVSGAFPSDQTSVRNEMVYDRVTGLVWAQSTLKEPYTWDAAVGACKALRLGDQTDWRVPTRIELLSLVNYDFIPTTSADILPKIADTWTSSEYERDRSKGWAISFTTGAPAERSKTDTREVRCVRAGRESDNGPDKRFTVGAETVFDKETSLTWQASSTFNGTFAQAMSHCGRLNVVGTTGFRMPTLHELHSIVDESRSAPALPKPLGAKQGLQWSSTARSGSTGVVWALDEYDGHPVMYDTSSAANVRCVK